VFFGVVVGLGGGGGGEGGGGGGGGGGLSCSLSPLSSHLYRTQGLKYYYSYCSYLVISVILLSQPSIGTDGHS